MKKKKYIRPQIEEIHVEQCLMRDTISVPVNNNETVDPDEGEAKQNNGQWGCEDFESAAKWRNLWDQEE